MPSNKQAECHPKKKHYARGLCKQCYRRNGPFERIPRQVPKCHPTRKHYARGLCQSCDYRNRHPIKERAPKVALCHPDRKHLAKGKCQECYYRDRYSDPTIRERILKYQKDYRESA